MINFSGDIVKLNTQSELAMTVKDVYDKFRQFEKHMDKRFDLLKEKYDEMLRYIKEGK